jgi:DNA end-binding protein Ku
MARKGRDVRSGVTFRQINKKTGNRLRQQLIDKETGGAIDPGDKGRLYEVDKGVYLKVEDEEIDAIAIESSHTIDIDSFVPKAEIDERYVEGPYYLIPANKVALEAFAVIRDAMRGKSMVALGRVVLSKRERVIMLQPWGKGLLGTTLRYPYEVRDEEIYFDGIGEVKIPKDMLVLAEHILDSKAAKFDASEFHDRYEEAIVAMLNEKKAGLLVTKQRELPRIVAGTDLMAALRQSIEKAKDAAPKPTLASKPAVAPKAKNPFEWIHWTGRRISVVTPCHDDTGGNVPAVSWRFQFPGVTDCAAGAPRTPPPRAK